MGSGRAGLKAGQVRLQGLHPHGGRLPTPLLTAPHQTQAPVSTRLFIGSETAGQTRTDAPGRPSAALDTGSSAGAGQGTSDLRMVLGSRGAVQIQS